MEGTLATIMDILCCTDIPTALNIITTMSSDHDTVSQLKEELETKNKTNVDLTDKLSKSEERRKNLLRTNFDIKLDEINRENTIQKEIDDLKVQLPDETKQIDE